MTLSSLSERDLQHLFFALTAAKFDSNKMGQVMTLSVVNKLLTEILERDIVDPYIRYYFERWKGDLLVDDYDGIVAGIRYELARWAKSGTETPDQMEITEAVSEWAYPYKVSGPLVAELVAEFGGQ